MPCLVFADKISQLPSWFEIKAGLHYQSFCDHSRNFALVKSKVSKDL